MAIFGAVLEGIEAVAVRVTHEPKPGVFDIRGLSEAVAREARVRVRASFAALGRTPSGIVTVAREDGLPFTYGAALDVAIAVAASGLRLGADVLFVGELSLNAEIRGVRGAMPMAILSRNRRIEAVFPAACARLPGTHDMQGSRVYAAHLREVFDAIETANLPNMRAQSTEWLLPLPSVDGGDARTQGHPAWSDVANHPAADAVRAMIEKGSRVFVLVGPAGSGRTMISRRINGLLPPLTEMERLDVDTIASAAGLETHGTRPFRAPHHTASTVAVVGGGSPTRPGEVTLAHHGVLLVDEANEMPRASLDALISVMKRGVATVSRIAASNGAHFTRMPAQPAVVVFSISLPTPRTVVTKDVPITTREQASLDALTKRARDLADRLRTELNAVVIDCPRIDMSVVARTGVVS